MTSLVRLAADVRLRKFGMVAVIGLAALVGVIGFGGSTQQAEAAAIGEFEIGTDVVLVQLGDDLSQPSLADRASFSGWWQSLEQAPKSIGCFLLSKWQGFWDSERSAPSYYFSCVFAR